jgi:triphosphoribosyl-dephospho-CoA synthetase
MSTTSDRPFNLYKALEPNAGVSTHIDNRYAAEISTAISLQRIADALEIIAAKPAIDPQEIYNAISEAGFAVARNIRGQ